MVKQIANKKKWQFQYIILPAILIWMLLVLSGTAFAADGTEGEQTDMVSVFIPVEQHFQTNSQNPGKIKQTWTYKLTALDDAPLPETGENGAYTFTMTGNETKQVGSIDYTHAGIYHYQLTLCKGPKNDGKYTVDKKAYNITVSVENAENGLTSEVIVENMCGEKVDSIEFEHLYTIVKCIPPKKTIKAKQVKTGDDVQVGLFIGAGITALSAIVILESRRRKQVTVQSSDNHCAGKA